jgi:ribbon-helix-helix CopG family protein
MPKKPVQFSIPDADLEQLSRLADSLGLTRSEVVRQSIQVYGVLCKAVEQGGQVFIENGGQRDRLARI